MTKYIVSVLVAMITASLILPPSIVVGVNMPPENPPTAATPNTQGQGQENIPNLPPVTETKDKQGDTILSSEDASKKVKVATKVKELSKEEKDFNKGYVSGVVAAFAIAGGKSIEELLKVPGAVASIYGKETEAFQLGYLLGFKAGIALSDTFSIKYEEPAK